MAETLYRKWRPRNFAELAGQDHVATTLVNALAGGRVSHAYLFAGPRGTGKTTTGRLIAKALNCNERRAGEPCNECWSCESYLAGRAVDLIELDAASNRGIDEIRSLREKVAFAAGAGDYKVYLIDEVHMLTEAAFNALLKTLEEPPPHVVFVLATTEAHKVPATIVSRCQRFDFRRVALGPARTRLAEIAAAEGFTVEAATLDLIARSATGSMRDAVNLLDQLVTSYGLEVSLEHARTALGLIDDARTSELARAALAGDLGGGLAIIASVRDDGLDLRQFQRQLVRDLRALLMVKSGLDPVGGVSPEDRRDLAASVAEVPVARILTALKAFGEADLKADPNSTLPLDLALADCVLQREVPGEARPQPAVRAPPPARGERPDPRAGPAIAEAKTPARPVAPVAAANAPAPSPSPVVAESAPSPEPRLAAAREKMDALYDGLRSRGLNFAALINGTCEVTEVDDTGVTLGFVHAGILQRAMQPANLKMLAEVVAAVFGPETAVHCVLDPSVRPWQRRSPARSPLVRAAQEMGARILSPGEE